MNTKVKEQKICYYYNPYDRKKFYPIDENSISTILRGLNDDNRRKVLRVRRTLKQYEEASEADKASMKEALGKLKMKIPAVAVSQTLVGKEIKHSGLLQVDFDGKDHPEKEWEKIKQELSQLPYVHRAFISPSGNGLKLFIRIPASKEKHLMSFLTAKHEFKKMGLKIDDSTKDFARLCFLSYDKEHYYKPFHEVEELKLQDFPEEKKTKKKTPCFDVDESLKWLGEALKAIAKQCPRPDYDIWLKIASGAMNSFGDEGYDLVKAYFPEEGSEYKDKESYLLSDVKAGTIFYYAKKIGGWKLPNKAIVEYQKQLLESVIEEKSETIEQKVTGLSPVLQDVVKSVKAESMFALAKEYLGIELYSAEGKLRNPTAKEAAVIISEHFKNACEANSSGVALLDGRLHIYAENFWQYTEEAEISRIMGAFAERLGHKVSESRHYRTRDEYVKQLTSDSPLFKCKEGKIMVNFANGTLHVNPDGEVLMPHDKKNGMTYILPFDFDKKKKAPLFNKYLKRVLPDEECRKLLMQFFGWIFLRDLKLEKILILLGDGENGKSVFFDIITALLGNNNVSKVSCEGLRKPETRSLMVGKLLNYGSELSGNVSPDLWKKVASGEPLEFRYLFENQFISDNYARLAYNANVLPHEVEHTHGYFRRYMIIPFEQTITPKEKDPDLAKKIIEMELGGVMNMILDGMHYLRTNRKFSACVKSDEYLAKHKKQSDSVAQFVEEEQYEKSNGQKVLKSELYKSYKIYCGDSGFRYVSKRKFGERLLKLDFEEGRNGSGRFWFIYKSVEYDQFSDEEEEIKYKKTEETYSALM